MIRQDGARDNVKEMIGPWRECGLVDEPAERRHQGEQVTLIHIGARRSLGLSTEQQSAEAGHFPHIEKLERVLSLMGDVPDGRRAP